MSQGHLAMSCARGDNFKQPRDQARLDQRDSLAQEPNLFRFAPVHENIIEIRLRQSYAIDIGMQTAP